MMSEIKPSFNVSPTDSPHPTPPPNTKRKESGSMRTIIDNRVMEGIGNR